jgi:tetratricopeptide (TPR) repeat protein
VSDADEITARAFDARRAGSSERAIALFTRARDAAPDRADVHANLAAALLEQRQASAAAAAARAALARDATLAAAQQTLAAALFAQRDFAGALVHYDAVLARDPRSATAVAGRGDCLRETGELAAAAQSYRRALAMAPDLGHAHANLAPLLLNSGDVDAAIAHCRRAIELLPDDGQPWLNLGLCLVDSERMDEAMDAFAEAEQRSPSALLACHVARAWERAGDLVQAQLWVDRAEAREPGRAGNRIAAASVLLAMGESEAARAMLEALCESDPGLFEAWLLLGRARWDDGAVADAVAAYERALALAPQMARVQVAIGDVRTSAGDLDGALDAYRAALAINPRNFGARCGVVQVLKARSPPEDVAALRSLLDGTGRNAAARSAVHAALAQHADAIGAYDAAVRHLGEANALQWQARSSRDWDYDPERFSASVDAIMATFDAAHFERVARLGSEDELPLFVVGMPRSGTTLTEQILASHPRILGVGERPFAQRNLGELPAAVGVPGADPLALVPRLDRARIAERAAAHVAELEHLLARAGRSRADTTHVVDKMPDNYLAVGWIATLFPRARIVHVRRDPRDIAVSCWITSFAQIPWACRLEHIADRIVDKERLMAHWRRVLPGRLYELDYEALVADTEGETRRLLACLGLTFDPACLEFHRREGVVRTASVLQVRQPVYARSVARWRRYEPALAPLVERLREAGILAPTDA